MYRRLTFIPHCRYCNNWNNVISYHHYRRGGKLKYHVVHTSIFWFSPFTFQIATMYFIDKYIKTKCHRPQTSMVMDFIGIYTHCRGGQNFLNIDVSIHRVFDETSMFYHLSFNIIYSNLFFIKKKK